MITHFRRRGSTLQRYTARRANRWLQRRLTDWAADPRTTIPQLHTALEEVLKNEPNPDWDIFAIKVGYLELMRAMERPMPPVSQQEIEGEWTFRLGDMALSPDDDRLSRGRSPLPLARARTQPARPAAALCQLPGTRGNPRAAAAEAGRLGQVRLPDLNEPGHQGHNHSAALSRQSGGTGRSPRATTAWSWPAGWSQPSTPGCNSYLVIAMTGLGHRIEWRTTGVLRTARHTANSSSCWPRRSIAASAGRLAISDEALVGTYLNKLARRRIARLRRWNGADSLLVSRAL